MKSYPPTPESLRKYLKANGINGHQAAEMLSVSRRTVGYWLAGVNHYGKEVVIPYTCWFVLRTKIEGAPPIKTIEYDGKNWDVVSPSLAIGPMNQHLELNSGEPPE